MNTHDPNKKDALPSLENKEKLANNTEFPGIIAILGDLGQGALINEKGLAVLFNCHPLSIRRAVNRGELPVPIRMLGKRTWTVGAIIRHVEGRLKDAAREAHILAQNKT